MKKSLWIACLWFLTGLVGAVEPGDVVDTWTLQDQYDHPYTLQTDVQALLVTQDMAAAKLMKAAMENKPQGYLDERRVVFVADIQRMPAIVSKLFAVPAMRKYAYRVMLDRDGSVVSCYSPGENQVLWMQLDQGKVIEVKSFDSAPALKQALEAIEP